MLDHKDEVKESRPQHGGYLKTLLRHYGDICAKNTVQETPYTEKAEWSLGGGRLATVGEGSEFHLGAIEMFYNCLW